MQEAKENESVRIVACSECLGFKSYHAEDKACEGGDFREYSFASIEAHEQARAKAEIRQLEKRADAAVSTLRNTVDGMGAGYTYNSGRDGATLRAMSHVASLLGGESLRSFVRCAEHLVRMKAEIRYDSAPLSLGWIGCGMVGGFIFHSSDRTWELHS